MDGSCVERLAIPPGLSNLIRFRAWIPESVPPAKLFRALVSVEGGETAVLVELWSPSVMLRRSVAAMASSLECSTPRTEIFRTDISLLVEHLELFIPEPFAIWCGSPVDALLAGACAEALSEKCALLPEGALWVISSLYDENIEIYCKGRTFSELEHLIMNLH
jgi:hypothetical protein